MFSQRSSTQKQRGLIESIVHKYPLLNPVYSSWSWQKGPCQTASLTVSTVLQSWNRDYTLGDVLLYGCVWSFWRLSPELLQSTVLSRERPRVPILFKKGLQHNTWSKAMGFIVPNLTNGKTQRRASIWLGWILFSLVRVIFLSLDVVFMDISVLFLIIV